MSSLWSLSLVMIVPAELRETANRLSCALGHDTLPGDTFSVPLWADGTGPATHYGCRTAAQEAFAQMLAAAGAGTLPEIDWPAFGLSSADVQAVLAGLIADVRPAGEADGHFDDALSTHGLARIRPPPIELPPPAE